MKIHVMSDVHNGLTKYYYSPPECDVIIAAGDIDEGVKGVKWLNDTFGSDIPIMYVAGNHEFYDHTFPDTYNDIATVALHTNDNFLNNKEIIIDDIRFLGATMWTDFNLYGDPKASITFANNMFNDSVYIKHYDAWLTIKEFNKTVQWLKEKLMEPFDGKTIVITHHAPSGLSCGTQFIGDKGNPLFASDLTQFIKEYKPDYWVHGHMHSATKYTIGDTTVLCNPKGYAREWNTSYFSQDLIIEL